MIYQVTIGDRSWSVELGPLGVRVDGRPVEVDFARIEPGPVRSLLLDGSSHRIVARRTGTERWDLDLPGRRIRAEVVDERTRAIREITGAGSGHTGPKPVVAPMPGMVVRLEVAEGERVEAGRGVVIVEAMKMENELRAEAVGVVTRIHVAEGEAVEKGQLLVDFGAVGADGEGPDTEGAS